MPRAWIPLALGTALCLGAYLGRSLGEGSGAWEFAEPRFLPSGQVLSSVLDRIDRMYVDPVDRNRLTDVAIEAILDELDPHSDWNWRPWPNPWRATLKASGSSSCFKRTPSWS